MTEPATDASAPGGSPVRWGAFALVCVAYLATTTGEALLAPIYPIAAPELGMDLDDAGSAFALLAASIAVANLVAGVALRWIASNHVLAVAVLTTAVGGLVAATADSGTGFLAAQVVLGAGAGLLYPAAIIAVGTFAGGRRRGFAMGVFGVFFSGGLTLAAALAALGTRLDWRVSFVVGSALALIAAVSVVPIADAPRTERALGTLSGLRAVLGAPTLVGGVGGISQYATVAFLPVFAVTVWGVADATAAIVLAAGRVLSVPAKLITGALADRIGPHGAARLTGLALAGAGAVWALSPAVPIGAVGAIVFTAAVSGLFPLANVLAFERVGRHGTALGAFRSVQIGAGAAAGYVIGRAAESIGLRVTVATVTVLPLVLVALGRRRPSGTADAPSGLTAAGSDR